MRSCSVIVVPTAEAYLAVSCAAWLAIGQQQLHFLALDARGAALLAGISGAMQHGLLAVPLSARYSS